MATTSLHVLPVLPAYSLGIDLISRACLHSDSCAFSSSSLLISVPPLSRISSCYLLPVYLLSPGLGFGPLASAQVFLVYRSYRACASRSLSVMKSLCVLAFLLITFLLLFDPLTFSLPRISLISHHHILQTQKSPNQIITFNHLRGAKINALFVLTRKI